MKLPDSNDTLLAANNIIKAIVDSNLNEREGMNQPDSFLTKILPSAKKSNDIVVSLNDHSVYVKINLHLQNGKNIIDAVSKLQQQISEEIRHLTGLNVKKIDVCVLKFDLETRK